MLAFGGALVVLAILGFLVLPALVVTVAAFNDQALFCHFRRRRCRCDGLPRRSLIEDFQLGLRNGLVRHGVELDDRARGRRRVCVGTRPLPLPPSKAAIEGVLVSPLFVPHFTVGLGFLILATEVGLARTYAVVIICHVVLVLPFVLRSVYVSLRNLDQRFELAAASLGAPPGRVLTSITLPLLLPGLVSGWLFAAILSFNEFTASLFVTAQHTQTLPVAMYNYVREYADPSMAALSVIYIVATAALLTFANAYLGLGKVLNVEHGR